MIIDLIPQLALEKIERLRTGDILNKYLNDSTYCRFRFSVAYMRLSGLKQLREGIEGLISRDGTVSGVIGINDGITSEEALQTLNEFSDSSTICYTNSDIIFHPKFYIFDDESANAVIVIGSPNLTRDGLYMNGELAVALSFDLNNEGERKTYEQFNNVIEALLDDSNDTVQKLNSDLIEFLKSVGLIESEVRVTDDEDIKCRRKRTITSRLTEDQKKEIKDKFPPVKIEAAPRVPIAPRAPFTPSVAPPIAPPLAPVPAPTLGATRKVWEKSNLPASAAQQVVSGSNPTGNMRLGQAGFQVRGALIDVTTYFISSVFHGLHWTTVARSGKTPLLEAHAQCHIELLGSYKGKFDVRITHDITRVSGQANVPTWLHWNDAMPIIRATVITGRTLELHEIVGTNEFLIRVV
ncbi:phospholipase D-like domain-containing protein [Paenibacillus lautus]|uniref:phospholipase D-like domain-containing protein n=1 Tax=Paenibacillus lautus TaxID=1401 RepID=UPI001C110FB9|nr:phospholipase D-like domain-containing protein [Paenibacillus lautus]MBU5347915.1 hypothetical protein [Paenibacillus lautus]